MGLPKICRTSLVTRQSFLRVSCLVTSCVCLVAISTAQQPTGKKPAPRPPASGTNPAPTTRPAQPAAGTPAATKAAPAAKPLATTKPAGQSTATSDAAKKAEIMRSERWHRAMFEMAEWLSAQKIYDARQVNQIKIDLSARVAKMSAADLQFMLDDMEAKFQVMETPEAKDARAWLGNYLTVASKKKREEILKEMPNLVTMTAAQLADEVTKIENERESRRKAQAAFDRARTQQVNAQLAANKEAQSLYIRDQYLQDNPSYSPYRSSGPQEKPFSDVSVGPGPQYWVNSFGQVSTIISPSSW